MGIRFLCPNGHKLNVKSFLAGKRAICPNCGARVLVPLPSDLAPVDAAPSPMTNVALSSPVAAQPIDRTRVPAAIEAVTGGLDSPPPADSLVIPAFGKTAAEIDGIPESIILTTVPNSSPDLASGVSSDAAHNIHRQQSQRRQFQIAIALLGTVIVLAVVLLWVLQRGESPTPAVAPVPSQSSHFYLDRVDARIAGGPLCGNQNRIIGS